MHAESTTGLLRLLRQDELPEPLRSLSTKYLLDLARRGRLGPIRPIRVLAHSPAMFREDEVRAFMETKTQEAHDARESVQ
jgi:hypothetical protein